MQDTDAPAYLSSLIDPDVAAQAIVHAAGNRALAAERLHVTQDILTASIARDPSAISIIAAQIRAVMLFDSLDAFKKMQQALLAIIPVMEAKDVVKAYTTLATVITQLTDNKTSTLNQNINVTETVIRMLPANVREAVTMLIESGQQDTIDDDLRRRSVFIAGADDE